MSERPHEARAEEQEDLLEQIFTQGLEKMRPPAQAKATEGPPAGETISGPGQENSEWAASPAKKKNKRSAVYLYLLILFGAAFLMLLLAYFVQQRSNETTISDLRESMNLSREQLLAEIKELEDKNAELEGQNLWLEDGHNRLIGELNHWQTQYEKQVQDANDLFQQYSDAQEELYSWESFWQLELAYQAENYLKCGHILLRQTQVFNNLTYSTPRVVRKRHDEIVRAVVDAGILDEDYEQHPDDYSRLMDAIF